MIITINPHNIHAYNDISVQLKVLNLTEAGEPEIYDNYIIFTYMVDKPVRYIGIRFEHEDYKELHIYSKNSNKIYFLVYEIPEGYSQLKYRMVIDGLWITDQFNSRYVKNPLDGMVFSIVELVEARQSELKNPVFEDNSTIGFAYSSEPGRSIYLIGDFNNWDPYMYKLIELSPGYYYISLNIGPGRHYYNFLIDGEIQSDPYNLNRVYNSEGNLMSFFENN
jgi:hypothetical protein